MAVLRLSSMASMMFSTARNVLGPTEHPKSAILTAGLKQPKGKHPSMANFSKMASVSILLAASTASLCKINYKRTIIITTHINICIYIYICITMNLNLYMHLSNQTDCYPKPN